SPEAQRVLEAASVMGEAFAAVAVAAGAQLSVAAVEEACDGLVAQQDFLDDTGLTVWPDGSSGGSYRFRHGLYQQVLYERLGRTWRARGPPRPGGRAGGWLCGPGGGGAPPPAPPLPPPAAGPP